MLPKIVLDLKTVTGTFQAMYAVEMEIAKLYKIFSEQFPEDKDFWTTISGDEVSHGDNIKRILRLIVGNKLKYEIGRTFNKKATLLMLENVKLYISDAEEKLLSKREILVIARNLESSLIEAKYMEYLVTKNDEYRAFMAEIVRETVQHKALIDKKLLELNKER